MKDIGVIVPVKNGNIQNFIPHAKCRDFTFITTSFWTIILDIYKNFLI
ncbi:MAG: hypothetical protein LUB59_07395 [Candidatus Gastranaerophilales bacterium]|nr:hypothetical protein [Candidatus Gastranaerophilales bacterium]